MEKNGIKYLRTSCLEK